MGSAEEVSFPRFKEMLEKDQIDKTKGIEFAVSMPTPDGMLDGEGDQVVNPELLKQAGYPNGFSFKMQYCSCSPDQSEMAPLLAAYFEQIGVKAELQPMEYGAFLSAMTTRKHAAGYLMNSSHTSPTTSIRKSFVTGQTWNPAGFSDPAFDKRMDEVYASRDEEQRKAMLREMTRDILDQAPYVWLPTQYSYAAWWPWVKNYAGEFSAGSIRPGPIYARIWIDQDLKKKLGH